MGFFDDLVLAEEPAAEQAVLARLQPPGADEGRYAPPVDRFAPALSPQLEAVGVGAGTRVLVTGWSVWPRSVTLHLAVFRNTRRQGGDQRRQSGLRVGLLFSDGRRVTSLDGTVMRSISWTGPQGQPQEASTEQAVGLIPLDPGLHHSRRSLFKTDVDLYLAELPARGDAVGRRVAGRRRARDPYSGRRGRAPCRRTPGDRGLARTRAAGTGGAPGFVRDDGGQRTAALLAPPLNRRQREALQRAEEARQRYVPQADWQRMGYRDWGDAALVRARLEAGAPPDARAGWGGATPLHLTAEQGSAQAVAALLPHIADVDVRDDEEHTPLWYAVQSMDEATVRALIDAGADVWTPQAEPWSPGRLLLTTPLAPLVRHLPGAVELPPEEVAAQQAADALIAAFGAEPMWTEGLGICFVQGLDEDELIRRLGADPAQCPRTDPDDAPFDPMDYDESLRYVGVIGVDGAPGGCVITQDGYMPSDDAVLRAISAGTTAYGVYFNPKGGTFGALARDGEIVAGDEIHIGPHDSDPNAYWTYRFWQSKHAFPYGADVLAYCCAAAGLRISDGRDAVDGHAPRRWVPLPTRLQR